MSTLCKVGTTARTWLLFVALLGVSSAQAGPLDPFNRKLKQSARYLRGVQARRLPVKIQRSYARVMLRAARREGTFRSGGSWEPFEHGEGDGAALVDWVLAQPWSNGKLGAIGCSYPGSAAIAAAIADPRLTVVYADGPAESEAFDLEGGVLSLGALSWHHLVKEGRWFNDSQLALATNTLNLRILDQQLLGETSSAWQAMLTDPTPQASYFERAGLATKYRHLCTPTIITDRRGLLRRRRRAGDAGSAHGRRCARPLPARLSDTRDCRPDPGRQPRLPRSRVQGRRRAPPDNAHG